MKWIAPAHPYPAKKNFIYSSFRPISKYHREPWDENRYLPVGSQRLFIILGFNIESDPVLGSSKVEWGMLDVSSHNYFFKIRDRIVRRITAGESVAQDSLAYWRVKIFVTIFVSGLVFCTFGFGFAIHLAVQQGLWGLFIADSACYAISLGLLLIKGIGYKTRVIMGLLTGFGVGLAVTVNVGPLSGGPIYLFAFAVIAGVLLGSKAALIAIGMNASAFIGIFFLFRSGLVSISSPLFPTSEAMLVALVNFIVLNLVTAISVSALVKGLSASHHKEQLLTSSLELEHEQLRRAKERLEIEIEERKQAESAVRASEAKYRLLADNVMDIIWLLDLEEMRLTYVSPSVEKVRGVTPAEAMAQPLDEILTPDSFLRVIKLFEEASTCIKEFNSDQVFSIEVELYKKDRSSFWAEITASLVVDDNGRFISLLGITRDITERKQSEHEKAKLETQLRQSKKMEAIGTLAGGIAHDFNNILASIIGYTEICMEEAPEDTLLGDNLKEIFTAGNRAKELVKQILTFARQTDDEVKPLQISAVVKEVLNLIRSSTPASIQIDSNIESKALVMGNPTHIHQVTMNLCSNAIHAMEENGGVLKISITDEVIPPRSEGRVSQLEAGHYIRFVVTDNGVGISPTILSSIFDPYFTTKEVGKGTGMGLAVVHGVVENYGGKIFVKSAMDVGTTVTIYLPTTRKRTPEVQKEQHILPRGAEHILLVDDEETIVNIGKQMLERLGYKVTVRTSSLEALALFRSKSAEFDLVLTDMTMPNMTGDRLAVELMILRPDVPVVLCTGYSDKISEESAAVLGLKGIAYKPLVRSELANLVRNALDESKN